MSNGFILPSGQISYNALRVSSHIMLPIVASSKMIPWFFFSFFFFLFSENESLLEVLPHICQSCEEVFENHKYFKC